MGDSSLQPEGSVVAAIGAVLVSGLPPATMAAVLGSTLSAYGITPAVIAAGVYLVMKGPVPSVPVGPAASAIAYAQMNFRAAYLAAAVTRMQNAVNAGMSLQGALDTESRFYGMHVQAQTNRRNAAAAVDREAGGDPDRLLIWRAKMDSRTSPECRAADGLTFTAATVPMIGYPGMVHPHCRCKAKRAPLGTTAKPVNTAMSPALIGSH